MVTMEIMRSITFEAGHWLPFVPTGHKCGTAHGHTYTIKVWVAGALDEESGWVVDFAELDESLASLRGALDHSMLNQVDGLGNPTAENLARHVFHNVKVEGFPVVCIEIHEGAHGVVRYVPQPPQITSIGAVAGPRDRGIVEAKRG
tara:strand:- start:1448 stop:1885 length:438 start_codon:yes stop_codon:yes gene_type:complete